MRFSIAIKLSLTRIFFTCSSLKINHFKMFKKRYILEQFKNIYVLKLQINKLHYIFNVLPVIIGQ